MQSLYGLAIDANRELPGARPSAARAADLTIDFRADRAPDIDPQARRVSGNEGWMSTERREHGDRMYRCASDGGTRAWSMEVSGDGARIEVRWTDTTELADVMAFVLGRGLAATLVLKGVTLLHGCALVLGERVVVVLGPSGAGKSTLAAAAVARGAGLLADDMAALIEHEGRICIAPGPGFLRLDDAAAGALGWDPSGLPRVFADPRLPGKRWVAAAPVDDAPRPVAAVCVLGARGTRAPQVERLAAGEGLAVLLGNVFGADLADRDPRATMLPLLARLAHEIPISRVHAADDLASLPALVDLLSR